MRKDRPTWLSDLLTRKCENPQKLVSGIVRAMDLGYVICFEGADHHERIGYVVENSRLVPPEGVGDYIDRIRNYIFMPFSVPKEGSFVPKKEHLRVMESQVSPYTVDETGRVSASVQHALALRRSYRRLADHVCEFSQIISLADLAGAKDMILGYLNPKSQEAKPLRDIDGQDQ